MPVTDEKLMRVFQSMRRNLALSASLRSPKVLSGTLNMDDPRNMSFKGAWGFPVADRLLTNVLEQEIEFDAIVGVPTGGDFWAEKMVQMAERVLDRTIPLYQMQKSWAGFHTREGQSLPAESRLLVVDDTFYSGETVKAFMYALARNDFIVAGVATPVELFGQTGEDYRTCWVDGDPPVVSVYTPEFLAVNGYPKPVRSRSLKVP